MPESPNITLSGFDTSISLPLAAKITKEFLAPRLEVACLVAALDSAGASAFLPWSTP